MSYSFIVRAADKAEAKRMIADELQKVVDVQPIHGVDRAQAQAVADAFIDILTDDDTKGVQVNMHGSVSYTGTEPVMISASVGVTVAVLASTVVGNTEHRPVS